MIGNAGRGTAFAAAIFAVTADASAAPDRFDPGAGTETAVTGGAERTGKALWPVPPRQIWGQVITQDGKNAWKDAVFTDPERRWRILYPATNVQMMTIAGPKGRAGKPVQAIMFDQRGEVVQRSLLVSDDDDLLMVS